MKQAPLILFLVAASALMFCHKSAQSDSENTKNLLILTTLNSVMNPSFVDSCTIPSVNLCINYYGASGTVAACSQASGTYSTSRCSCTGALGMCTYSGNSFGSKQIRVYNTGFSNPSGNCAGFYGTFSSTCSLP